MRERNRALVALFSALVFTISAAAEPELRVTATGKELYLKPGSWSRRQGQVLNKSDQALDFRLDCLLSSPQTPESLFRVRASVPAGWIRRVDLSTRPFAPATGDRTDGVSIEYILFDQATGRRIESRTVPPAEHLQLPADRPGVWILQDPRLSSGQTSHRYLIDRGGHGGPLGIVRIAVARIPATAPDRWWGYDSAQIVILKTAGPTAMRGTQVKALADWVRQGGLLVLTGGEHLSDLLLGPLGQIAGVTAPDHHEIRSLEVIDANGRGRDPVALPAPVTMNNLSLSSAEVVLQGNSLPLLTRRRHGAGTVMVLAVPTAGLAPEGLREHWFTIRKALTNKPPVLGSKLVADLTDSDGAGWSALRAIAGRPAPSPWVPMLILLGLAGAVVLAGLALGRRRRGEWIWLLLVPCCLAGAIGAWAWGAGQTQQARLTTLSVVVGNPDGTAGLYELHACYSGPEEMRTEVTAGHANATVAPLGESDAMTRPVWLCGPMMRLADQRIPINTTRSYSAQTVLALEGVQGHLEFNADGLLGRVNNRLGAEMRDCVLYYNRRTFPAADLEPDQSSSFSIDVEYRASKVTPARSDNGQTYIEGDFTGKAVQRDIDTMHNALVGRLLAVPDNNIAVGNTPYLIGYVKRSWLDPLGGRDLLRRAEGVVFWPMQFRPAAPGTQVAIPFGLTVVDLSRAASFVRNPATEQFIRTTRPASFPITVRPPTGSVLQEATAQLRIQMDNALTLRLVVEGLTGGEPNGQAVELASITAPAVEVIEVPDADRFRDETGRFHFRLRAEMIDPTKDVTEGANWTYRRIEAALKGTTR